MTLFVLKSVFGIVGLFIFAIVLFAPLIIGRILKKRNSPSSSSYNGVFWNPTIEQGEESKANEQIIKEIYEYQSANGNFPVKLESIQNKASCELDECPA